MDFGRDVPVINLKSRKSESIFASGEFEEMSMEETERQETK